MNRRAATIALLLCTAYPASLPVCHAAEPVSGVLRLVPFDNELYTLGYDVFLANSNPFDAFLLARKAVAARPSDLKWRLRAAQSAEWSGNPLQAAEHWQFLATATRRPEAMDNALRLARDLRDYRRIKQLLERRGIGTSTAAVQEYVAACEQLGAPEDAIVLLEPLRGIGDNTVVLQLLARLYEATGRPKEAIDAYLQLQSQHAATPADLLRAAALAYGNRDLDSAYAILALGRESVPDSERGYWESYADTAWALQDLPAAEMASGTLLKAGAARVDDYLRLIAMARYTRPDVAYDLSVQGWQRYGRVDFIKVACEIGIPLKRHQDLATLLRSAERSADLKPQDRDAYYWYLSSQVFRGAGALDDSVRSQRQAISVAPDDESAAAAYLWLLIDLGRRDEMSAILMDWHGLAPRSIALREATGAAYAWLGEYDTALRHFQPLYGQMHADPAWLATYADILEQVGWHEAAFVERVRIYDIIGSRLREQGSGDGSERRKMLSDLARISLQVAPGDGLNELMGEFGRDMQDDTVRELVAVWALAGQRSDLARRWFWREYFRMTRQPRWVELALALEDNDRDRIARLMQSDLDRLPHRDAIEGAERTGSIPLAETLAFEHLQRKGRDHLLDRQLRELYGSRKGGIRYDLGVMDQSGVGFLTQQLSVTAAATDRVSLRLELDETEIRHRKQDVLGLYPRRIQGIRAGFLFRHRKGSLELLGGMRDGLASHAAAGLQGDWQLDSRSLLEFGLQTGAEATESVRLKVGGLKDEARLALHQRIAPRDTLSVRGAVSNLADQERNSLGRGYSLDAELTHRLLAGWPDTVLRTYAGYHRYRTTGTPEGGAYLLMPSPGGVRPAADASYFVPESFGQAGVGIMVGQDGRSSYLRAWQPFLSADAGWNSSSGTAYRFEGGVGGPLVGLDRLELSFSRESGSQGSNDTTSRIDMRYRYYFE